MKARLKTMRLEEDNDEDNRTETITLEMTWVYDAAEIDETAPVTK